MMSRFLLLLLVVALLVVGFWWYEQRDREPETAAPGLIPEAQPPAEPRYPVPDADPEDPEEFEPLNAIEMTDPPRREPAQPLPPLEDSDGPVLEALAESFSPDFLETWLVSERIVERTVVFTNSLDGPAIPLRLRPVRPAPGEPSIDAESDDDGGRWNPSNARRYRSLITTMEATEPAVVADLYLRYYPLFQQAHDELASSERYFNDRLVDVIDHLLDTPEIPADFEVEPWEGHYRFADPELEEQSWGRKMVMRMGPEQAALAKNWLREFRERVAGAQPNPD